MFDPGVAIALELIALSVGALVIIACHDYRDAREYVQRNVFPKFIGYFTVIIAFVALLGSLIACFSYWMDAGGTVKGIHNSYSPSSMPAPTPPVHMPTPDNLEKP
jgi:hypothetical protein